MTLWGGIKRRIGTPESDIEYDQEDNDELAEILTDMLNTLEEGIEAQHQFNQEALQLFSGILEELQAIRDKTPAFHEGVNTALEIHRENELREAELAREAYDEFEQKRHDEMLDAMEDKDEGGMSPLM